MEHHLRGVKVGGGVWSIVFVKLRRVGVGRALFWVGGARWKYIFGGWAWVRFGAVFDNDHL